MKASIKKLLAILLVLPMICLQTGCENANEINDLVVVMGIGFDEDTKNPDNIKLIAQVVLPDKIESGSSSAGSAEKAFCNVESSAQNTFEAIREYTHIVCNKLYTSHNQVFVIGREIAQRGIAQYMDFFVRAKETRPTTVIVVADTTAAEVMNVEPKMNTLPAINITKLILEQVNNSQSMEVTVLDYLNAMQSETTAFLAPIVSIVQQEGQSLISVKGLAVFSSDRMIGELDENEARGLLWVLDKVESGSINVIVEDQKVAVEIVGSETKIQSQVQDGKIVMNISIEQKGTLAFQSGAENLATDEKFHEIEQQVEQVIRSEIMLAFNKAKELGADIFGFGEILHKYHNEQWKTMEENWAAIFPAVELNIEVEATIVGSGTLTNSAQGEE